MNTPAPTDVNPSEVNSAKPAIAYGEGILGGLIGAATIAIWFFIVDCIKGRPFFTPSVLGTVVFHGPQALDSGESHAVSFEMVLVFTWFHVLVFCGLGLAAAWLIHRMEEAPELGYGILLLIVILMSGFLVVCLVVAEPVLHALTIPSILVGNLLATLAMGGFFWWRHPRLKILP